MTIPVFVINLKTSVDRREHTVNQLNNIDISYEIVNAVNKDWKEVQDILIEKKYAYCGKGTRSRYLLREEMACLLSHATIYRKMVEENIEVSCILEDDNNYNYNFNEFINLENINVVEWDILHLGHHGQCKKNETKSRNKVKLKVSGYCLGEPIEMPLGTYAYLIKKHAAKILLNQLYPIRMPADHYTGSAGIFGIRNYVVSPPCVFQNYSFKSTIHDNMNMEYKMPFFENIRIKLRKIYILFPWLQSLRVWFYINKGFPLLYLRKYGLIRNYYTKYK